MPNYQIVYYQEFMDHCAHVSLNGQSFFFYHFSLGTLVSSTNKTDRHDITDILLKVVLNTINLNLFISVFIFSGEICDIWASCCIFPCSTVMVAHGLHIFYVEVCVSMHAFVLNS